MGSTTSPSAKNLVHNLVSLYGVKDIFVGVVIYITAHFVDRKTLGCTLIAASGVAFADGLICWNQGRGEWHHRSYVPMLIANGSICSGFGPGGVITLVLNWSLIFSCITIFSDGNDHVHQGMISCNLQMLDASRGIELDWSSVHHWH